MDNTQVTAKDGSWFLFADWQGMTRIGLPGDKVKTDGNLDRPHQTTPLVIRANGQVSSAYAVDIDPVALKKLRVESSGHGSPDPLGGAEIVVNFDGREVSVGGAPVKLEPSGGDLPLGGSAGRREVYGNTRYDVYADGALVILGCGDEQTQAALVVRGADGAGRVAWCRPTAQVPYGLPNAFREGGSTWLADLDGREEIGYLVEIGDDGNVVREQQTHAVAGPWVLDGKVWWQPDEATVCVGDRLGEPKETFELSADHDGAGRLLRLSGRKLFLPWHGVTILDFAPAKKGKGEISRKHKASDEPIYREAERILLPFRAAFARRDVHFRWRGCTRSGKRIEPQADISGRSNIVTYLAGYALQYGAAAKLAPTGVTSVGFSGGGAFDDIIAAKAPTAENDIRDLVRVLDAAGISRASGIPDLYRLDEWAAQRKAALPITPEAVDFAIAAVLSGLRGETHGPIPPATAESLAAIAPVFTDDVALRKAGINGSQAALFLAVAGHRRFGAEAAAPVLAALIEIGAHYANDVAKALGEPVMPYVAPKYEEPALDAGETALMATLDAALVSLGVDPKASTDGLRWRRFQIDGAPFQAGLHDDLRVTATLCATETDVNLRTLGASLAAANKGLSGARFFEADCYIHARAACAFTEVSEGKLRAMVEACRGAIASEKGQSLRAKYRTIG